MYKQNLYKIHTEHLSSKLVKNNNRYKKFEYGYNKDLDPKMPQAYRGIGRIPISIINAVRLLDDPQEN